MKNLIFTTLSLATLMVSSCAFGVDGYKDLKFGMSKKQVFSKNICSFHEGESGLSGLDFYYCEDLPFGGKSAYAEIYFINDNLQRVLVTADPNSTEGLVTALRKKYGDVSSMSTQRELEDVDRYPNKSAFIAFDNNTVYIYFTSNENHNLDVFLLYTTPEYDVDIMMLQAKTLSDDL